MKGYKKFLRCLILLAILACGKNQTVEQKRCQSPLEVPCDDGFCTSRENWCDYEFDCPDGSDEQYCKTGWFATRCTHKHFQCRNNHCVPAIVRCDGYGDCEDNSDEDGCQRTSQPVADVRQNVTEYSEPQITSTPIAVAAVTTSTDIRTFTDYYDRKRQEADYQRIENNYYPPGNYGEYQNQHNRNQRARANLQNRGSDTAPSDSFPGNQPWYYTTRPPRVIPEQGRRRDPYRRWESYDTTQHSIVQPPTISPQSYIPTEPADQNPYQGTRNYAHREPLLILPPRTVLYPPSSRFPYYYRRKIHSYALPPFYFARNYTEDLKYDYRNVIEKAKDWLIEQRDIKYGWGKNTPRALVALSLMTNSFISTTEDNELMKKSLQTHLGIKILRNDTRAERMSTTTLAMYINALLATCQDPRDFLGRNLVEILNKRRNTLQEHQRFVNPLIYLTLCLSNETISYNDMQGLLYNLDTNLYYEIDKDIHILSTIAVACLLQDERGHHVRRNLEESIEKIKNENLGYGKFGSVYTTALAAQALMSVNTSWDSKETIDYIAGHQYPNGSFGDMQLTYLSIIAISGRSLVHLRNTKCDPKPEDEPWTPLNILNAPGPTKRIFYSLKIGYPETFSTSQQLTVPEHTNAFDIMRVAEYLDNRFKFKYKITDDRLGVYSILNIPNDPERGLFWSLYRLKHEETKIQLNDRYKTDIRNLIPEDRDELLFWYLPD